MKVQLGTGTGTTHHGPGVEIKLSGNELAEAVDLWVYSQGVVVRGPRTITVDDELCRGKNGRVYVDPSGFVMYKGKRYNGTGTIDD